MGAQTTFTDEAAAEVVERYEIYALIDPRDGAMRYIGKANNVAKRLQSHMRSARYRRTPVYTWISKLTRMGLCPAVVVLETVYGDWRPVERRMIAQARMRGERLLNLADGGDEPYCPPAIRTAHGHRLSASLTAAKRAAMAKISNDRVMSDPIALKRKEDKRRLTTALKAGELSDFAKGCMRECARLDPAYYGDWSGI